jgi:hypothetical protein
MRQDFDDTPTAVTTGAVEIIFAVRGKQESPQIVGKTGKFFQDLLARTSG